jgi:hypothetical protein
MTDRQPKSDLAVVTAKRLDSDAVDEFAVEVEVPSTELGQQSQLTELVRDRFPDAEFKSFANEAASFLEQKLLIVAAYRRSAGGAEHAEDIDDDESQQQLFAA